MTLRLTVAGERNRRSRRSGRPATAWLSVLFRSGDELNGANGCCSRRGSRRRVVLSARRGCMSSSCEKPSGRWKRVPKPGGLVPYAGVRFANTSGGVAPYPRSVYGKVASSTLSSALTMK